jgi:hypothetical protein
MTDIFRSLNSTTKSSVLEVKLEYLTLGNNKNKLKYKKFDITPRTYTKAGTEC